MKSQNLWGVFCHTFVTGGFAQCLLHSPALSSHRSLMTMKYEHRPHYELLPSHRNCLLLGAGFTKFYKRIWGYKRGLSSVLLHGVLLSLQPENSKCTATHIPVIAKAKAEDSFCWNCSVWLKSSTPTMYSWSPSLTISLSYAESFNRGASVSGFREVKSKREVILWMLYYPK